MAVVHDAALSTSVGSGGEHVVSGKAEQQRLYLVRKRTTLGPIAIQRRGPAPT